MDFPNDAEPSGRATERAALERAQASIEAGLAFVPEWVALQALSAGDDATAAERRRLESALAAVPAYQALLGVNRALAAMASSGPQQPALLPQTAEPAPPAPAPEAFRTKLKVKDSAVSADAPLVSRIPVLSIATRDDLTRIRGIDAGRARQLAALGVSRFSQIAGWRTEDVRAISESLGLGRDISRQNWIEQASLLAGHGAASRQASDLHGRDGARGPAHAHDEPRSLRLAAAPAPVMAVTAVLDALPPVIAAAAPKLSPPEADGAEIIVEAKAVMYDAPRPVALLPAPGAEIPLDGSAAGHHPGSAAGGLGRGREPHSGAAGPLRTDGEPQVHTRADPADVAVPDASCDDLQQAEVVADAIQSASERSNLEDVPADPVNTLPNGAAATEAGEDVASAHADEAAAEREAQERRRTIELDEIIQLIRRGAVSRDRTVTPLTATIERQPGLSSYAPSNMDRPPAWSRAPQFEPPPQPPAPPPPVARPYPDSAPPSPPPASAIPAEARLPLAEVVITVTATARTEPPGIEPLPVPTLQPLPTPPTPVSEWRISDAAVDRIAHLEAEIDVLTTAPPGGFGQPSRNWRPDAGMPPVARAVPAPSARAQLADPRPPADNGTATRGLAPPPIEQPHVVSGREADVEIVMRESPPMVMLDDVPPLPLAPRHSGFKPRGETELVTAEPSPPAFAAAEEASVVIVQRQSEERTADHLAFYRNARLPQGEGRVRRFLKALTGG